MHTMKKNLTEIVLVIDRSGSMAGLEADTIGGVNALIAKNQQLEGEAVVTTVLFDHETITLHDRVDIREVQPLTERDYQPRGCTALLDAVGAAVEHIAMIHRYLPQDHVPEHTIFAITTDGQENASKNFTYAQVKQMIEQHTEKGWEFLFLGANIDAAAEAGRIGIAPTRAAQYVSDSQGSGVAYDAVCGAIESKRCCASIAADWAAPVAADTAARSAGAKAKKFPFKR